MGVRFAFVIVILSLLYGWLGVRFYNLQIEKGKYYSAKAATQTGVFDPIRGDIFFTDNIGADIPVAIKKDYPSVFSDPKKLASAKVDVKESAAKIAEILGVLDSEIEDKISQSDKQYIELAKTVTDETAQKIKDLNIEGIYVKPTPKRFYPYSGLASHILGFVSDEDGKYGLESFYNKKLKGEGGVVVGGQVRPAQDGSDIYLTIDRNIQAQAEKTLNNLVAKFRGTQGTVIVMNPKTGEVLAMAGAPSFDPNKYGEIKNVSDFTNQNVQSVFEPGSVMKLVTMSSAVDSGKVTPETTYIDTGSVTINGRTMKNWDLKAHGRLTMADVIEQSINTGTVFAESRMGHQTFYEYLKKFGFMDKTGIDLPGERIGDTHLLVKGADVNYATASFGQGISVTPVRMLTAVNAIANHGVMVKPHLNRGDTEVAGNPISKESALKIVNMMVAAVDKAKIAHINNYSIAGKTGTALAPDFKKGGYTDNVIDTYIGFAPAYDPRFSIFIRIDEPAGAPLAGQTVVPAFRELAEFIISYYNIPPDRTEK